MRGFKISLRNGDRRVLKHYSLCGTRMISVVRFEIKGSHLEIVEIGPTAVGSFKKVVIKSDGIIGSTTHSTDCFKRAGIHVNGEKVVGFLIPDISKAEKVFLRGNSVFVVSLDDEITIHEFPTGKTNVLEKDEIFELALEVFSKGEISKIFEEVFLRG